MKRYWYWFVLCAIVLVSIAVRILIAYQTDNFQYAAYFGIREAEHISKTGFPLYADPLSYQGRTLLFPPVFYYFAALMTSIVGSVFAIKVVVAVLSASTIVLIYLIVELLTGKVGIALCCAGLAGFTPAFFALTVNSLSPYSLAIPLFLLALYLLFIVRRKNMVFYFFSVLFLLVLTHPIVSVFILGLLIVLLLLKLEGFRIDAQDYELLLFVTFLVIWISFLLYKKAFLFHGVRVILQNLPPSLLVGYFQDMTYVQMVYLVGFIPLFFGVIGIYHVLFRQKKKSYLYVVSFSFAFFLLLFLKLLPLEAGLAFLSFFLIIMTGCVLAELSKYFVKTRFSWLRTPFFFLIGVIFLLTSVFQTVTLGLVAGSLAPSDGDIAALEYVRRIAPENSTVLAPLEEGFLLTAVAKVKNVADENFLLVPDADVRYEDMELMFTHRLETGAVRLFGKYDVDYVFFSERYFEKYGRLPDYVGDGRCFELVYDHAQKVYASRCRLR